MAAVKSLVVLTCLLLLVSSSVALPLNSQEAGSLDRVKVLESLLHELETTAKPKIIPTTEAIPGHTGTHGDEPEDGDVKRSIPWKELIKVGVGHWLSKDAAGDNTEELRAKQNNQEQPQNLEKFGQYPSKYEVRGVKGTAIQNQRQLEASRARPSNVLIKLGVNHWPSKELTGEGKGELNEGPSNKLTIEDIFKYVGEGRRNPGFLLLISNTLRQQHGERGLFNSSSSTVSPTDDFSTTPSSETTQDFGNLIKYLSVKDQSGILNEKELVKASKEQYKVKRDVPWDRLADTLIKDYFKK